ncbi:unnamed protein product, partial [Heterosigma akashiwo]
PAVRRPTGRTGTGAHRVQRSVPLASNGQLVLRLALRRHRGHGHRGIFLPGQKPPHPRDPLHVVQIPLHGATGLAKHFSA